jgi:hypothetical protein
MNNVISNPEIRDLGLGTGGLQEAVIQKGLENLNGGQPLDIGQYQ